MRDAAVDVDTERTLILVERLARLLGRHQGFKVGADGGVNVYPSSLRVRLPAEKQEAPPRPAKRDSRSGCPGDTRAPNARTRRSAARAATHAQRRAQAEDRLQLPAGNLASKVWAAVRVATRLLAWRIRARFSTRHRASRSGTSVGRVFVALVERAASLGTREAILTPYRPLYPTRLPILVGTLIVLQWPSSRAAARPPPAPSPPELTAPPPATQLAALAPPRQQPTLALAAAARATLDPSELQDLRGSKRDALARTPPSAPPPERPPPAESRKKTRGTGALQAALAAAAPAAAAPQPPTATTPLAPALLADANPFRLLA
jgi:hypothetical protein